MDSLNQLIQQFVQQKKLRTIKQNQFVGKLHEDMFAILNTAEYEVVRTGHGHDFKIRTRFDPKTGKPGKWIYIEVKSSPTAPLSRLQKKKKPEVVRGGVLWGQT